MQQSIINVLALAGVAAATITPPMVGKHKAFMALEAIMGRQVTLCEPIHAPYTCERSCGSGYTECVSFPNCFNPGNGESCCADGTYCPEGYYCTNVGCCPNGASLSECGADSAQTTLPGGPISTSAPSPIPTPTLSTSFTWTSSEVPSITSFFPTTSSDEFSTTTSESSSSTSSSSSASGTDESVTPTPTPSPTTSVPPNAAGRLAAVPVLGAVGVLMAL